MGYQKKSELESHLLTDPVLIVSFRFKSFSAVVAIVLPDFKNFLSGTQNVVYYRTRIGFRERYHRKRA